MILPSLGVSLAHGDISGLQRSQHDANRGTDLAFPAEKRSMDETFLRIYGFYCDLGLYIRKPGVAAEED